MTIDLQSTAEAAPVHVSDVPRNQWWRDATIYQIYPRSFMDGNGDGIGDFQGIRSRLPYLRQLGVDGIWLNPFYPSPNHDQGYDISDYTGIDPDYGTLEDFDDFVDAAHLLGLRIIVDVVANHCSIEHPLFQEALQAGPGSVERSRFHFADGSGPHGELPPNNWRSMFGGSAWTRVEDGQWYLHLFTPEQPDFNWRNPATIEFFDDVLRFWLDRGVDGFRLDAAQGLFKHADLPDAADPFEEERVGDAANELAWNQPEVHDVYRHWRTIVDEYTRHDGIERPLVGEITGFAQSHLADYVADDQLHQGFFFEFMKAAWSAQDIRRIITHGINQERATTSPVTWVLGNHDTVRVATRFAGGAPGVSHGDPAQGVRRARAAALLSLALPGSAYIFQGEELGLPEVVDLTAGDLRDPIFRNTLGARRGRDGCRVPLPWSGDNAPFGHVTASGTWLPQPDYFRDYTVESEDTDDDSTLNLYRRALLLRKAIPGSAAAFTWLDAGPGVIAFKRGSFLCVTNMTGETIPLPFTAAPTLTSNVSEPETLAPDATAWWLTS